MKPVRLICYSPYINPPFSLINKIKISQQLFNTLNTLNQNEKIRKEKERLKEIEIYLCEFAPPPSPIQDKN